MAYRRICRFPSEFISKLNVMKGSADELRKKVKRSTGVWIFSCMNNARRNCFIVFFVAKRNVSTFRVRNNPLNFNVDSIHVEIHSI